MSDSSGESGMGRKKKSFASRISSKISNTFKKGSSDSDDEGDPTSSRKHRHGMSPKFSRSPPASGARPPVMTREDAVASALPEGEEVEKRTMAAVQQAAKAAGSSTASSVKQAISAASSNMEKVVKQPPIHLPGGARSPPAKSKAAAETASSRTTKPTATSTPVEEVKSKEKPVVEGAVHGTAEIVLTGVKGDSDEVINALRKRGFMVHLAMVHEDTATPTMTLVLAMGPKLLVKCSFERNLSSKKREEYTSSEVSELCADAIRVIQRSKIEYEEATLLHDKKALKEVMKADRNNAANAVNGYFGPYMGLYFAWLGFYTRALIFPAAAGAILWLIQWRDGTPDGPLLPICCVLVMVWVTIFLELWRRRNNELRFRWGVESMEDEENVRVVADKKGKLKAAPASKFCVTIPVICVAIFVVIRAMLYCIWLTDHAIEVYGEDSYQRYIPLVLYSIFPLIAATLYSHLAKLLNEFEEHPDPVKKKNMLVVKMFAFQFVNSYCALFYVAFWLKDVKRLRNLIMTMMMAKQFVAQLQEKYQPQLLRWWKLRQAKKTRKEPRFLVKHTGTVTAEELFDELANELANVDDDYLEMVLQFGYVSMFVVVFPLAPFFAVANNIWEFKLDLGMLGKTRRPQAHAEATIGSWEVCLEIIGVVACLTNLLLVLLVSEHVSLYVPTSWSDQMGSFEGKVVIAIVAEHLLLVAKAVMSGLIEKTPRAVREAHALSAIERKKEKKELTRLRSQMRLQPSEAPQVAHRSDEDSPAERLRQLHSTFNVWQFSPMWYLPLAILPFAVAWFKVSALWVLPLAFLFVSYLQNIKDKADAALSLGVVKDPKVLKMITGFLPRWYTESDVERVDWLNKLIQKLWISASDATKDLLFTTIQPIIDSYRPPGISALGFRKVSLGTIPPKVVGIRALEMKGNKAVLDLDLRWAANAEFVVEAGVKPVPLLITLNKIRFSGRLRVELAPLVPVFPCFGALVFTFMEKPFLDFAFSLGKLDVMSIGPGEASVGAAVSNTIKNVLDSMMVFPKKMVIPILAEQDVMDLSNPIPTGVVRLTVVGADSLRSADVAGKSDPYVKIKLGDQNVKTDVKNNRLAPRWNETFDLLIYEPSVEIIGFNVKDKDTTGDDDDLGHCELPISVLVADVESAHNLALSGTKTGSLLIKTKFVPLSSGAERKQQDEDEIVNAAGDEITDDVVASEAYEETGAAVDKPGKGGKITDPGKLSPTVLVVSEGRMGVLTVMGIECKGVKKGDRYVSIVVGNTKRKTAVEKDKSSFAYSDVFHFLVNDSKSAVMEVFLKEDETIGHDKVVGSFKVYVAEVIANDDQLESEWDLTGEKAQGSIKIRLKWSGRVGQQRSS